MTNKSPIEASITHKDTPRIEKEQIRVLKKYLQQCRDIIEDDNKLWDAQKELALGFERDTKLVREVRKFNTPTGEYQIHNVMNAQNLGLEYRREYSRKDLLKILK